MYREYYGLTERPFDLTPDPRYLYLTPMHREALAAVQYGITARRGIVVVIGEAGTGKTTIVRAAIRALKGQKVRSIYLNNPMLSRSEFFQFLARAFGLSAEASNSKVVLLSELTAKLARAHGADAATVLIVDEAQSLPRDLLEEIRLLANIETSTAKLLQVVLAGQPELGVHLNDPSLRQLKQRIAIRAVLEPLDLRATSAFIAGRLRVAGGQPAAIFTPQAVELIYRYSGGVARTINVICDNALLAGFAGDLRPITPRVIEDVTRDFDLSPIASGGRLILIDDAPRPPAASAVPPPLPPLRAAAPPPPRIERVTPVETAVPPPPRIERVMPVETAATPVVPATAAAAPITAEARPAATPDASTAETSDRPIFSSFGARRRWFSQS